VFDASFLLFSRCCLARKQRSVPSRRFALPAKPASAGDDAASVSTTKYASNAFQPYITIYGWVFVCSSCMPLCGVQYIDGERGAVADCVADWDTARHRCRGSADISEVVPEARWHQLIACYGHKDQVSQEAAHRLTCGMQAACSCRVLLESERRADGTLDGYPFAVFRVYLNGCIDCHTSNVIVPDL
jgi:hypothetical protein